MYRLSWNCDFSPWKRHPKKHHYKTFCGIESFHFTAWCWAFQKPFSALKIASLTPGLLNPAEVIMNQASAKKATARNEESKQKRKFQWIQYSMTRVKFCSSDNINELLCPQFSYWEKSKGWLEDQNVRFFKVDFKNGSVGFEHRFVQEEGESEQANEEETINRANMITGYWPSISTAVATVNGWEGKMRVTGEKVLERDCKQRAWVVGCPKSKSKVVNDRKKNLAVRVGKRSWRGTTLELTGGQIISQSDWLMMTKCAQ